MLDLYLIRHAESEMNNNSHLIGGRSNSTPLSERGKFQAYMLGQRFKDTGVRFDKIYSSPAVRAHETSRIVSDIIDYPVNNIILSDKLLELDQGGWEGKVRAEILTPELIDLLNRNNWNFKAPNGESQRDVEERMLDIVVNEILGKDPTVALFTHGMAIKCLLRGIMGFDPAITYKIVLDNTSITRLKYTSRGWHPMTINDSGHLIGREKLDDVYSCIK
jgi:broad specificity phosphatase PhoE